LHLQQESKTKTAGRFILVERLTAICAKHISYIFIFWVYDHSFDTFLELLSSLPLQPLQPPLELRSIVISVIVSVTTTFSSQDCFLRTETIAVFPSYLPCCTVLGLKLCIALTCHDVSFTDGSCCFDVCTSSGIWANMYGRN
jgi:hypothetical protein